MTEIRRKGLTDRTLWPRRQCWMALVATCAALAVGGCATVMAPSEANPASPVANEVPVGGDAEAAPAVSTTAASTEETARPGRQKAHDVVPQVTRPNVRGVPVPVHVIERRPQVRPDPRGPAVQRSLKVERPGPAGRRRPGSRGLGFRAEGAAQAMSASPPRPAAPSVEGSFESTTYDDNAVNTGAFFIPADPVAAAGPTSLVNAVNVTLRFHGKDGSLAPADDMALAAFFTGLGPDSDLFDPKVLYDEHADRFVVVALDYCDSAATCAVGTTGSRIFVAVSDDSTPQGTWYQAAIDAKLLISSGAPTPASEHWVDFPGLAVDEEAVYITGNMFDFASGAFGGVRLWIIDKFAGPGGGIFGGGTATINGPYDPYESTGVATTTQPAHVFGAPAEASVGTFLVSYSGLSSDCEEAPPAPPCTLCAGGDGAESVQLVRIDDPTGTPIFSHALVDVGSLEILPFCSELPTAPQSGTGPVETNDRSVLNAVWRDETLYFAATIDPRTGSDAGEATVHWWQLEVSDLMSISVDQGNVSGDVDIATDSATFFPSVAVNAAGEMALGFSASSTTIFPGSYYTTRKPGDAPGTTSGEEVLRAGLDSYERTFGFGRNRWGDYSSVAVDPATQCFWAYNKHSSCIDGSYAAPCSAQTASENGRWGTAFGRVCIDCETSPLVLADWSGGTDRRASEIRLEDGADILAATGPVELEGQMIRFEDGFSVGTGGVLSVYTGFCPLP